MAVTLLPSREGEPRARLRGSSDLVASPFCVGGTEVASVGRTTGGSWTGAFQDSGVPKRRNSRSLHFHESLVLERSGNGQYRFRGGLGRSGRAGSGRVGGCDQARRGVLGRVRSGSGGDGVRGHVRSFGR